ncbi:nitric oxide reductase activation protein NorD [Macrococcus bovicus]|uniref:nitric oxide reductase activation protein NorD n=1 Tax=Macrococcus bovicus TaxID=69968 RepID=UPI0025A56BDE|nr:VWA domain-containing protein [Macrococcus bovicus]WJP96797.1 VWA domain-containing protein [Macrococcus bovicus]
MSDKFILFNDEKIDASQLMMLTDLAQLIMEDNEVKVKFQKFGYYDPLEKSLNVSFKWKHRSDLDELYALKSDCLLYGLGYRAMDQQAIHELLAEELTFTKFRNQLFMLLEEYRLQKVVLDSRPAAAKYFRTRMRLKRQQNSSQIKVYETKKMPTDLLFLRLERAVLTDNILDFETDFSEEFDALIRQRLSALFELKTTADTVDLTLSLLYLIEPLLTQDMLNDYYYLPVKLLEDIERFKEEKATALSGHDSASGSDETEDVRAKTSQSSAQSAYMQTEISEGQNSRAESDHAREGHASDEPDEIIAGRGQSTSQKDGEGVDIAEELGTENERVSIEWRTPKITERARMDYSLSQQAVMSEVKKLTNIIQKTIAHQNEHARRQLAMGRLDRKLVNWFIDDQKRVFYKEDQQSKELDATFTLLVDASYSMEDKLEETKKGIVLFHETLKKLLIRHEVVAFNEDTFSSDQHAQLNIFDYLISYQQSLSPTVGPGIETIAAQDDNRDGLAIRVAGEMLKRRSEKQKFLIVFSDGEPSAFEYESNGIIDTHEAVMKLRREGIFIINVFLSQTPISEAVENTIKNIYNDYCVFVEGVENLPYIISPLLKKLLLQSLH